MGWGSAVHIFDSIASSLLDETSVSVKDTLTSLVIALEDRNWDTQRHSEYYDHPIVQEIMRELHPSWFEDEDEEEE